MYDGLSRRTEGDAARRAPQKKRKGVELIFPISTSACLPSPPFLLMTVFSFFLFFQPVGFRERNQGLPHQTTFVRFITEGGGGGKGTLVHAPGHTRYCAHAPAARSRESAEQRDAIGRSYARTYICTRPTGAVICTTAFVPRLEHTAGRSSTWPHGRQSSAAEL